MPRPMESCNIWDVVKVPFPYTNRPIQQYRPALVVARHDDAAAPSLLWVLMITSAVHRRWQGDVEILDLAHAGLPAESIVRCAKIATIENHDAEKIGHLSPSDQPAVRSQVAGGLSVLLSLHG